MIELKKLIMLFFPKTKQINERIKSHKIFKMIKIFEENQNLQNKLRKTMKKIEKQQKIKIKRKKKKNQKIFEKIIKNKYINQYQIKDLFNQIINKLNQKKATFLFNN
ncbi:hypothetical protein TTHERM_000678338 (macronuclear) [Tetrahymena thermophila SB210]|uniref:Uncharacterized protein n=1 Tax=Tetrahymena thermophila (strain SB210) TaxID=312017 RepID=W7XBE0_TETTS|nr:hypothetical protein TTHERM_000678338 [Tetrahymena thermophila SB210]EWS70996.1 hypothetical protein TTHERM_000678338 [Tetrahymena thermophila SB210]|eukprot:XP_012656480.1 hypothetical protein TTHERM_000678338 [Tetrahymena thermophila SB210]